MSKAVIFDHDGVIIDNQQAQEKAWKILFKEYDLLIPNQDLCSKIRGRPTLVGLKTFFKDKYSDGKLKEISNRKEGIYQEIFKKDFKIVKGFHDLIKDLKNHHIPMAIATSTTKVLLDFSMQKLKAKTYFDIVVTAEDVTKSKPDPEVYLQAAKKLKVKPSDCVVFEDSFSGVRSAKLAGMKVILMETTQKLIDFEDKIELAVKDFTQITALDLIKL